MGELQFVTKSLVYTAAVIFALQFNYKGETLEERAEQYLESSPVMAYVRQTAAGGANALRDAVASVKQNLAGASEEASSQMNSIKAKK